MYQPISEAISDTVNEQINNQTVYEIPLIEGAIDEEETHDTASVELTSQGDDDSIESCEGNDESPSNSGTDSRYYKDTPPDSPTIEPDDSDYVPTVESLNTQPNENINEVSGVRSEDFSFNIANA